MSFISPKYIAGEADVKNSARSIRVHLDIYAQVKYTEAMKSTALSPLQLELRDAMGSWGCPLCRLVDKAVATYLDSLNYERVLDINTWESLQASRGMCERHSRAWEKLNGCALGMAMVNRVVILNLQRATDPENAPKGGLFRRDPGPAQLAEALASAGQCPACALAEETASRFADVLLKDIQHAEAQALLRESGGLCLPHLRMTLARPGARRNAPALIAVHREVWAELMGELEEFIRKNDYRFQDEKVTEREGNSWRRALDIIVGLKPPSKR